MARHFIYSPEVTWGTYVAPAKAVPVLRSGIVGDQPMIDNTSTGLLGRGRSSREPGTFAAGGPVEMNLYPLRAVDFIKSVMGTRVSVIAGTGFRTKMLPNDDAAFGAFSAQQRLSATAGTSFKGLKVGGLTISARVGEYARLAVDLIGKDAVGIPGGTWTDGAVAPTIIDPVPYLTTLPRPFKFYQAVMRLGGTVSLTAGELVVTGGTPRNDFDDIEVGFDFGLGEDAYGVNLGDRTRQSVDEGEREVSVSFSPNFAKVGNSGMEFWHAWKDGVPAIAELYFEGPIYNATFKYQVKITMPRVLYNAGSIPEVARTSGLQRIDVAGTAEVDDALGYDFGIVIQTTEDLAL